LVKPNWLRVKHKADYDLSFVEETIGDLEIHTVCDYAACPNRSECYSNHTATFMILGKRCTRACSFCNVEYQKDIEVDTREPVLVYEAVKRLKLGHVVITSVTRDDLDDGGASMFAKVINKIKTLKETPTVEVLVPDFKGSLDSVNLVLNEKPEVFGHNIETISRLYPSVRPEAQYERSLKVLGHAAESQHYSMVKSGLMVGLGEKHKEVEIVLNDLYDVGCRIVTIGQYLQPSKKHYSVVEYVNPDQFKKYEKLAYDIGFSFVLSGPFVRSSYKAAEAISRVKFTNVN